MKNEIVLLVLMLFIGILFVAYANHVKISEKNECIIFSKAMPEFSFEFHDNIDACMVDIDGKWKSASEYFVSHPELFERQEQ